MSETTPTRSLPPTVDDVCTSHRSSRSVVMLTGVASRIRHRHTTWVNCSPSGPASRRAAPGNALETPRVWSSDGR